MALSCSRRTVTRASQQSATIQGFRSSVDGHSNAGGSVSETAQRSHDAIVGLWKRDQNESRMSCADAATLIDSRVFTRRRRVEVGVSAQHPANTRRRQRLLAPALTAAESTAPSPRRAPSRRVRVRRALASTCSTVVTTAANRTADDATRAHLGVVVLKTLELLALLSCEPTRQTLAAIGLVKTLEIHDKYSSTWLQLHCVAAATGQYKFMWVSTRKMLTVEVWPASALLPTLLALQPEQDAALEYALLWRR